MSAKMRQQDQLAHRAGPPQFVAGEKTSQ